MAVAMPRMTSLLDHLYDIRYGIGEPYIMMYVLMATPSRAWRSGERRAVMPENKRTHKRNPRSKVIACLKALP